MFSLDFMREMIKCPGIFVFFGIGNKREEVENGKIFQGEGTRFDS